MADAEKFPSFTKWAHSLRLEPKQDPSRLIEMYRKQVLGPLSSKLPSKKQKELELEFYQQLRQATDQLWSAWAAAAGVSIDPRQAAQLTQGKSGSQWTTSSSTTSTSTTSTTKPDAKGGQDSSKETTSTQRTPSAWTSFTPKAQYGDLELKGRIVLKDPKTEDKPLPDVMRPPGTMELGPEVDKILKAGCPGHVFLGFVQLAMRTGGKKDLLRLVPYMQRQPTAPEDKKVLGISKAQPIAEPIESAHARVLDLLLKGSLTVAGWKPDPKSWYGIDAKHLPSAKEAGCYLGFLLVLGEPKEMPYIDFRSDINRYATAKFSDSIPVKPQKLNQNEQNAWRQYQMRARYPMMMSKEDDEELAFAMRNVPVRRGWVKEGEKRMPLAYGRMIVETLKKALGGR